MKHKVCIRCSEEKPLVEYHKHKGMADGHLNKCRACVKESVAQWRIDNPDCRKKEHARKRQKEGFKTREQYLKDKKENAIGRSVSSSKYIHKRRVQKERIVSTELDDFVFEEACSLRYLREEANGIKWHVDHIVPLNHKKACGLHVAANFQVVPASWNTRKSNKNMNTYELAGY